MKTMPSLLAPAGNMRALQTALRFGADAVYCGAKQYGLRAQAGNFDEKQLEQAVTLAHAAGAQVNLTLNIFAFDGDLDGMVRTAQAARDMGVDAAIISDLGAIARRSAMKSSWNRSFTARRACRIRGGACCPAS